MDCYSNVTMQNFLVENCPVGARYPRHARSRGVAFDSHDSNLFTQSEAMMSEQTEMQNVRGTYCLHCGDWISVQAATARVVPDAHGAAAAAAHATVPDYVMLWCDGCRKEAPYLTCDFIERKDSSVPQKPSARSAAVPWGHGMVLRRGRAA
jgi:hypothetical protein